MSNLDPFDVLGISHGCTWGEVKLAYKRMCIKTHPDKMNGDARYFMMVHDAFDKLQQRHNDAKKFKNAPSQKVFYTQLHTDADNIAPEKMENFTPGKFNAHFEKHKITDNNPYYQHGYGHMMAKSSKNREDIDVAKNQKINIPTQKLVIYKEPESLQSSKEFSNCYNLGEHQVDDFSGGGGTDILQAYSNRAELVDTQRRYKNMDDIMSSRSGENLSMTHEEQIYYQQRAKDAERLERYRLNSVDNERNRIAEQYVQLHRRLQ